MCVFVTLGYNKARTLIILRGNAYDDALILSDAYVFLPFKSHWNSLKFIYMNI
eukprot:UN10617